MWGARNRRREEQMLEKQLRSARPRPRDAFVQMLTGRLRERQPSARPAWSRLAFAAAVSSLIVGTFASFGGLGYAGTSATTTYHVVKNVVVNHKVALTVRKSSAAAQYPGTPQGTLPASKTSKAGKAAVAGAVQARTLPFTGFSLLGTVIVSLALIGLGLVLRRRERGTS